MGCIVFVTVVIAILFIAALISATGTGPQAEAVAHGGTSFTGTVLSPVAFDT